MAGRVAAQLEWHPAFGVRCRPRAVAKERDVGVHGVARGGLVQRRLLLRVEGVGVCVTLQEEFDDERVTPCGGVVERGAVVLVAQEHASTAIHKQHHRVTPPFARCLKQAPSHHAFKLRLERPGEERNVLQRHLVVHILMVDVGATLQQHIGGIRVSSLGGQRQRALSELVLEIDGCLCIEK